MYVLEDNKLAFQATLKFEYKQSSCIYIYVRFDIRLTCTCTEKRTTFSLTLPMRAISFFLFERWEDVLKEDKFCEL